MLLVGQLIEGKARQHQAQLLNFGWVEELYASWLAGALSTLSAYLQLKGAGPVVLIGQLVEGKARKHQTKLLNLGWVEGRR